MAEITKDNIQENFVFLTENLSNVPGVLRHLFQGKIISENERELINSKIGVEKSEEVFLMLRKKDFPNNQETIKRIFRETGNSHLIDAIQKTNSSCQKPAELKAKWWPEEKKLTNAFHERKVELKPLVDVLYTLLENSKHGSIVITGLGGLGKSTSAKWFAQYFQNNYDHIIWINCDKNRFEKSFKTLAIEMKIDESKISVFELEYTVKILFEKLSNWKCLWILDNAEGYVGEHGIRNFLPKSETFHTIITSRNREKWSNHTGDGQITEYRLGVFEINDSIGFMRKYLDKEVLYNHNQLRRICNLLGNLPLALQIAVATLNGLEIDVSDYIDRIKITNDILHEGFDDYERTIHQTMTISLDLIRKSEKGDTHLAFNILQVFGYLTPDDVSVNAFKAIENLEMAHVRAAVDSLVKYSLVERKIGLQCLSIHRLLQQVIRANGENSEKVTLRKILKSSANIEYKLIPYTLADEELKSEFSDLSIQFGEQIKLTKLLHENKLDEALSIAEIINHSLNSSASKYNHAVCLSKTGETAKAIAILQTLSQNVNAESNDEEHILMSKLPAIDKCGIMDLQSQVPLSLLNGLLFTMYDDEDRLKMINSIAKQEIVMKYSPKAFNALIEFIDRQNMQRYVLTCRNTWIIVHFANEDKNIAQLSLDDCSLNADIKFPRDLKSLNCFKVILMNEMEAKLTQYSFLQQSLKFLKWLTIIGDNSSTEFLIHLEVIANIDNLHFENCTIVVQNGNKFAPKAMIFKQVNFMQNGELLEEIAINSILEFRQLSNLSLRVNEDFLPKSTKIAIDFGDPISFTIDLIEIRNVNILNWETSKWSIKNLCLGHGQILTKSDINVKNLELVSSSFDFSTFPQSVEQLSIFFYSAHMEKACVSGEIKATFNYLRKLKLLGNDETNKIIISSLRSFHSCPNLTNLEISLGNNGSFNFDMVPETVKNLKLILFHSNQVYSGTCLLNRLRIDCSAFPENLDFWGNVNDLLKSFQQFQPQEIVIYFTSSIFQYEPIVKPPILPNSKITIGKFNWGKGNSFESCHLAPHVDRMAEYFTFENGKGTAIDKSAFDALMS